jgi:hypothetical protein
VEGQAEGEAMAGVVDGAGEPIGWVHSGRRVSFDGANVSVYLSALTGQSRPKQAKSSFILFLLGLT